MLTIYINRWRLNETSICIDLHTTKSIHSSFQRPNPRAVVAMHHILESIQKRVSILGNRNWQAVYGLPTKATILFKVTCKLKLHLFSITFEIYNAMECNVTSDRTCNEWPSRNTVKSSWPVITQKNTNLFATFPVISLKSAAKVCWWQLQKSMWRVCWCCKLKSLLLSEVFFG